MSDSLEKGFLSLCQLHADGLTFKDVRPTFGPVGIYVNLGEDELLITVDMISKAKVSHTMAHMVDIRFERTRLASGSVAISRMRLYFDDLIYYDFYNKDGDLGAVSFRYEGFGNNGIASVMGLMDKVDCDDDILNIMVEITEFLRQVFALGFNQ